jgi:CDGSH-type Zn-finger protein
VFFRESEPVADKDQAVIAEKKPSKAELKAGEKYFWCACGRSKSQPFCDGSHRGTSIKPLAVSVDQDTEAYLCQCKATGTPPYCDGSHGRSADRVATLE